MSDDETFDDAHDPLERIEPDAENLDAEDVDEAWEDEGAMEGEAPSG